MYKIDKKIPLPNKFGNRFPLDKMLIGDSFFVPFNDFVGKNILSKQTIIRNRVNYQLKRQKLKIKLSLRKESKGVRFWRVK